MLYSEERGASGHLSFKPQAEKIDSISDNETLKGMLFEDFFFKVKYLIFIT